MSPDQQFFIQIAQLADQRFVYGLVANLTALTLFFLFMPGVGGGMSGLFLRAPLIAAIALCVTSYENRFTKVEQGHEMLLIALGIKAFALALIPLIIIGSIRTAGYFMSVNSGLNFAGVIDPSLGQPQNEISKLLGDLKLFLFLAMGGHLVLLKILIESSSIFGLGEVTIVGLAEFLLQLFTKTFALGLLFALPMLGGIFLVNLGLGILSKAVPTFNVFVMGYPLTLFMGVAFILFFLNNFVDYQTTLLDLVQ
ncbi:MAG: flagellar biosynthetic protein FliR [Thermoplasmatales archaeon]